MPHHARDRFAARWYRPWIAIVAVTAIAAGVRMWGLTRPTTLEFDENYYAKAACIYVGGSDRTCRIRSTNERLFREQQWDVGSYVHPPLGKWTIALGIEAFGMDPFGWRIASAIAGTLAVTAVAILAQLLLGSVLWTFVSGLLLATEHLSVVLSRLALLDVHQELWVLVGFLCLVLDRRWIDRRTPPEPPDGSDAGAPSPIWRPWRYAAGIAMGAAAAVKWSGALAIVAAVVISLIWETTRRRRGTVERGRAFARTLGRESFGLVVAFLVLPIVVYTAIYLPWLNHFGWDVHRLIDTQLSAARFHLDLREFARDPSSGEMTPTHYAYSRPWEWLVMTKPVVIATLDVGDASRRIVAIGNPVVFWGAVWAIPYLAVAWWRKRDWVPGFLLLAILIQYLPWVAVARPQFFFYVAPFTPFLVLALVYLCRDLADARLIVREADGRVAIDPGTGGPAISTVHPYRPVAVTVLVAAVALFVWSFPVLSWITVSDQHLKWILWFPGWR